MAHAIPIQGEGGGLAHVMEKGGQPQGGNGGHPIQRFNAVGVDVPAVMGIALVKVHAWPQFRDYLDGSFRKIQ